MAEVIREDEAPLVVNYSPASVKKRRGLSTRLVLVLYCFAGCVAIYAMRVNLSVAIVTMVNQTFADSQSGTGSNSECKGDGDDSGNSTNKPQDGPFEWDQDIQGLVLSSFFFGYTVTQVPAGWLTTRLGGKNVLGYGILSAALLSFITPAVARTNVYLLMVVRGIMGLVLGGAYPAVAMILSKWLPPLEHSKYVVAAVSGSEFGSALFLPISGYLCSLTHIDDGWPLTFYVAGGLGVVWFLPWVFFIHESPSDHPRVSPEEKNFIEQAIGSTQGKETQGVSVPWRAILLSPAVWATCLVFFVYSFGFYAFATSLPSFYEEVLNFNIQQNGFLTALPFMVLFLSENTLGNVADWLRDSKRWPTTRVRKLSTTSGFFLAGGFLLPIGFLGCHDRVLAVALLTLSAFGLTIVASMLCPSPLDLSPRFSGVIMGFANMCGSVAGILAPYVVGLLTNHEPTRGQWEKFFLITCGLYFLGIIGFLIFGSGEVQKWNDPANQRAALVTSPEEQQQQHHAAEPI